MFGSMRTISSARVGRSGRGDVRSARRRAARSSASGVLGGMRPFGGSTISDVRFSNQRPLIQNWL